MIPSKMNPTALPMLLRNIKAIFAWLWLKRKGDYSIYGLFLKVLYAF